MEEWPKVTQVSTLALIDIVSECLPLLGRGSTILGVSSRGLMHTVPNYSALGTTKAFTESLIRYLAIELAPRGIRANVNSPATLDTSAFRAMFLGDEADKRQNAFAEANPGDRGLEMSDVVSVVDFLAGGVRPEPVEDTNEIIVSSYLVNYPPNILVVDGKDWHLGHHTREGRQPPYELRLVICR